jgi:hypothetical protein
MRIPYYIKKSLNERLGYDVITIEPNIEEKTKIFSPFEISITWNHEASFLK